MQLDKLVHTSKRELICKDNTFFYPKIEISKSIRKKFDQIDRIELKEAIQNKLNSRNYSTKEGKKMVVFMLTNLRLKISQWLVTIYSMLIIMRFI